MPTEREIHENYLGPDLSHWQAVCRGEYCACCDELMPSPPWNRGLRLCRRCWPGTNVPFASLRANLMWNRQEGWTLCFCNRSTSQTGPRVSHWLLLHDRAECIAILDRYLCNRKDREELDGMSDNAGHLSVAIFVGPRRLEALTRATQRDSRTGYEKRQALARTTPRR